MNERGGATPLTVYLDVDGVVTTVGYQRRVGKDRLDPAQVALVAGLVREFDARVVVSSTWRIDDCRPTLIEAGLPEACFHPDWRTAILPTSRDAETGGMLPAERAGRGDEITEHATRNRITDYLVLDDVEVGPAHAGRHVRPAAEFGLSEADGVLARRLLAGMDEARRTTGRNGAPPATDDLRFRRD
ncbi:HAD domain-containing protein [Methylobacterium sp. E-045]|uniref:HAD domain-containing protein n=1 Tax=Methylobacterium sp. E-045 TaxID=2836575 RepID=UPI001FBA253A|nr:HAD domain-containing protein [Methylobacterium sp. E-045]MCJ2131688.1 HAD domain-containing protein [Methylobacterium sp. E-045]